MPMERALEEFEALRQPVTLAELERLNRRLATHVDAVAEAALSEPDLPVGVARQLAAALGTLIEGAGTFDPQQRGIVFAAARYFILTGDADNDLTSPHGLVDDVHVFNEACRLLGCDELKITL